jgi:hypothetical protein
MNYGNPISRMRGGFFYFFPDTGIIRVSSVEDLGRQRIGRKNTLTPMGWLGEVREYETLNIK